MWDAWPTGAADKTTTKDAAYRAALGPDRTYMMGVSPWFFANVYGKNWLWRGDDLWFDRWQQVLALQPDVVQIITWNDYGESHYVGPIEGVQPMSQQWVNGFDHQGTASPSSRFHDACLGWS